MLFAVTCSHVVPPRGNTGCSPPPGLTQHCAPRLARKFAATLPHPGSLRGGGSFWWLMVRSRAACSPMVQTHVRNDEAWAHGRLLQVGRQQFLVDRNPPTVDRVRPQRTALDARLDCAQARARMHSCQCSWADEPIQPDHCVPVLYSGGDNCCGRSNT